MYCGNILDEDATLTSCGIKTGVMVHVLKKKETEAPVPARQMSEIDIQQLVAAFRVFTQSYGYRSALQRLYRPEVLKNLIAMSPGLADDAVAIAMIQDPELLFHMSDPDTVRRIAELHPSLPEAANQIAAAVHEEASSANSNQPGTSSGYSYSLEALSDDEEMDSSSSDGTRDGQPLSRNHSYSRITSAQVAAALASAQAPSTPASTSNRLITTEMFSQAMQQAFANVTPPAVPAPVTEEGFDAISSRLAPQLQQMREMGLMDDMVNVQALQATNGDVQAAIDLVFTGLITSD